MEKVKIPYLLGMVSLLVIMQSSISEAEDTWLDEMKEKKEYQALKIKAEIKMSPIMGEIIIRQPFYDDGTSGRAWIKVSIEPGEAEITTIYLLKAISTGNVCPDDPSMVESIDLTEFFDSNRTRDATKMEEMTEEDPTEWKMLEDFQVAEGVRRILLIRTSESQECFPFEVEESEGVYLLELQFPECSDYSSSALTEVISKRTGMPKSLIIEVPQLANGSAVVENGCSMAKVAFISKFGNQTLLRQLYMALYSPDDLGRFSPSKACMTDLNQSFINRLIVKAFVKNKPEEPKMCPTDPGKDWSKVIYKYEQQVAQYGIVMEAYKKKYGNILGISDKGSNELPKMIDFEGDKKPETTEDIEGKSFYRLAKYIGMPKVEGIDEKKKEIQQLASIGTTSPYQKAKLSKLQDELAVLTTQEADINERTYYGLCLVSLRGEGRLEKLMKIKQQLDEADVWEVKGDKILRELLIESIAYSAGEKSFKNMTREMLGLSSGFSSQILGKKLRLGLGLQSDCASDEQKRRVILKMMRIKYFMENISMYLSEGDSLALREIVNAAEALFSNENALNTGKEIFIRMFVPQLIEDDLSFSDRVNELLDSLSEEDDRKLRDTAWEFFMNGDLDALMLVNVLLANTDSLDGDCGFTSLAKSVFSEKDDVTGGGCTSGREESQYEYPAQQTNRFSDEWGQNEWEYMRTPQRRNAVPDRRPLRRRIQRWENVRGGGYNIQDRYYYQQRGFPGEFEATYRDDWSSPGPDERYSRSGPRMDGGYPQNYYGYD